tara:strand:- start:2936 stop:3778 length:843 start_codon:yes stop_codon:yes gene_type:complete
MISTAAIAVAALGSKPNILLVNPDDMLSAYGAGWPAATAPPATSFTAATGLTPHFDRIINEGATFTRAYSASGMCSPARAALLSGRYPSRNAYAESMTSAQLGSGVRTKVTVPWSFLTGTEIANNVAATLRSCAYTTGAVGKWHLTPGSESGGEYSTSTYATQQASVKSRGFDYADGIYIGNMNTCTSSVCGSFTHNNEWLTLTAARFMSDALAVSTPFFLYYNPTVPHSPLSKLILSDGVCSDGTTVSIHHFLYAHDDVMYTRFFLYSTILLLVKTDDM